MNKEQGDRMLGYVRALILGGQMKPTDFPVHVGFLDNRGG